MDAAALLLKLAASAVGLAAAAVGLLWEAVANVQGASGVPEENER